MRTCSPDRRNQFPNKNKSQKEKDLHTKFISYRAIETSSSFIRQVFTSPKWYLSYPISNHGKSLISVFQHFPNHFIRLFTWSIVFNSPSYRLLPIILLISNRYQVELPYLSRESIRIRLPKFTHCPIHQDCQFY